MDRDEPLTRLDEVRAPHNVVAALAGLADARKLIESLERAGIEATHISLLGAQPAHEGEPIASAARQDPEGDVGRSSAKGAVVGGGLAGLTGAAIGLPGVGPLVAGGLWAIFGASIGGAVGGVSSVGLSRAWEQTFSSVREGNVAVGVHSDDADEVAAAAEVMERVEPLSVNRFDD